jgi:glutaredoxin
VKELLSHAGIPFVTKNVELDLSAYKELLARGFRTVPVTFVGEGEHVVAVTGFNESGLKNALGVSS